MSFDELSEYEREVLAGVHEEYGSLAPSTLRNLTHALPEWFDPGDSSTIVDPAHVLRASGMVSEEDLKRFTSDAEESYFLDVIGTLKV